MDPKNFLGAYHDLKDGFVDLINSLSALRALSTVSVDGRDERRLLEGALQVLMQNQDLECCSIYLLEDERLVNRAGLAWGDLVGSGERHCRDTTFALGEGIVGLAAATGEIQHCRDTSTDERFLRHSRRQEGEPPVPEPGSVLSVPIKEPSGRVMGVLNVSYPYRDFFTETHERTLVIFANFFGQLLMNNRFVSCMEALVEERTEQLQTALSEAERLKREYERLSVVDELTKLHNRRFFFPEAKAALVRALRYGQEFAIVLLDLDFFKQVNDTFGHGAGDMVLRQFADLLREISREADILARFGGEEFVIAVPETGLEGAAVLGERVQRAIAVRTWEWEGRPIPVTTSIGISSLEPARCSGDEDAEKLLEALIHQADQALYFGKQRGRNQSWTYREIACGVSQADSRSDSP